ncbi:signal peptide peptidase-domain-containing protein [Cadophora sp. MPI-SDFR-AT-0126]|nr:signal peptide peptidase-domain-containing protein [Leotiomycetes sp. MPI-SDFR-AT-0126]
MDAFFSYFEGDSPVLQFIGKWSYIIYARHELIQMYIHLILAAVFPIYIGSHASLRRPPSAAVPKKKAPGEDGDDEEDAKIEGMTPSDAILFPILAGVTLGGLYLVIKWLDDPKLLNKILNVYFSGLGVFGVGKLAADCLNVATNFIFPNVWSTSAETYFIEPLLSQQVTGKVNKARVQVHRKFVEDKTNPFPGFLSSIQFSPAINKKLWSLRATLKNHWIFKAYVHGVFTAKGNVKLNDVLGFVIGVATIALYNMNGKAWWLTNIMGFGFCYGTLQLMSPTTFWTGTLVLAGLFIYDIVMVFYTPLMVTVATSLEVPIKLVFPGPKRGSMLGLGDVVLPGIMMALALRFDLYLHYLRKQRTTSKPTIPPRAIEPDTIIRAPYVEATGQWGERFWTRLAKKGDADTVADGARFSKVYFKASLVGYVLAMLVTLVVMNIFNHAQPALLYLVPGVLTALWGTALVKGDVSLMWEYSEDGEWGLEPLKKTDKEEAEKDKSENGAIINEKNGSAGMAILGSDRPEDLAEIKKMNEEHKHHVFLFSLEAPRDGLLAKAPKI